MKPMTGPAQAAAVQQYGHEPVLLAQLSLSGGDRWFAGKDLIIGGVHAQGRLLSVGAISNQRKQDNVGMVGRVGIELDDSDGSIKAIIDSSDIEYASVTLYQWFQGLSDITDLCKVFKGQIVGPIVWTDQARSLSIELETMVKDQEVGLSVDPIGTFPIPLTVGGITQYLDVDAVDKPWPLSFGNVVHSVPLRLITAPTGRLKFPFRGPRNHAAQPPSLDPYLDDAHFTLQDGDGAYFPQGVEVQVQIDGVIFSGTFSGDVFTVGDSNLPKYEGLTFGTRGVNIPYDAFQDPDQDVDLAYVAWLNDASKSIVNHYVLLEIGTSEVSMGVHAQCYARVVRQEGNKVWFDQKITTSENYVPPGGDYNGVKSPTGQTVPDIDSSAGVAAAFHFFGPGDTILQVAKNGRVGWAVTETSTANNLVQKVAELSSILWRFPPETEVTLWKPVHKDVYVANLIPATAVVAVFADRRTQDGVQELRPIPPHYYSVNLNDTVVVHNQTGDVTAHPCTITFETPLRDFIGQGWSERLYVVMRSTVGPNTADVIKWLLDNYSSLGVDAASFTAAATAVANYPCAFTLHEKENVMTLCDRIAFCARMGLVVDIGQVSIKYLSTVPSTDMTLDESKVALRSLALTFTSTEDIYTRITGRVRLSYYNAKRFEKEMVYAANVAKFGLRRREIDFFIYNIQALAQKSLNFWGGRFSNSWRQASLTVPLDGLRLQMFDTVALAFADTGLINSASMQTVVTKDEHSPTVDPIKLELWIPCTSGSKAVSPLAWQSDAGDVAPADPTLKYAVVAFDLQRPNGESKRSVTIKQEGGSLPAVVVNLGEAGNVSDADQGGDATVTGVDNSNAQAVKVNVYGNGFGNPPTKLGVIASVVDPSVMPVVDQRIMVTEVNGKTYAEVSTVNSICYQEFDANDQSGKAYEDATRPIQQGARYAWVKVGDKFFFRQVSGTKGPVANWICWPGLPADPGPPALPALPPKWGQNFLAKITSLSPMKATPMLNGLGGGWQLDPSLAPQVVKTFDGFDLPLNTIGLVCSGTLLDAQELLFFQGGGGASIVGKITGNAGLGTYSFDSVDPDTNIVDGILTGATIRELGRIAIVEVAQIVFVETKNGNYYFQYKMENCSP